MSFLAVCSGVVLFVIIGTSDTVCWVLFLFQFPIDSARY